MTVAALDTTDNLPNGMPEAGAKVIEADVLVIGGGLVGGIAAAALDVAGLTAVVVDRESPATALDAGFDGRASAIARASQQALEVLGLWEAMAEEACPIHDIRVSEGGSLLFLHYDHRELADGPFGFLVENRILRRSIAGRLPALSGIRYLAPAAPQAVDRDLYGVRARLADGREIRTRLAIGADGRGSWTRRQASIPLTRWSYGQSAIVCAVAHTNDHCNIAHERFLPGGPFAILPLVGRRSSLVWVEPTAIAGEIMGLDDDAFLAELGDRFGDFLGELQVVGPRWCHPLSLQFARETTAPRLALVGDAAHAMHPIAGQGLNMGIRDVAALVELLAEALRLGLDIGSPTVLARYERWRRFDNHLMLAATDGLNRLFANDLTPLRWARNVGMAAVDRIAPLKRAFVRQAMGLTGDLPRLLRGERP